MKPTKTSPAMTSNKPYLVRAFNEWILDNQMTPYLLIDAEAPQVYVPKEYVQEGRIVFNITPGIVSMLNISNEMIEFEARFSGRKLSIYAPMNAILAIYAKENGQGIAFEPEEMNESANQEPEPSPPSTPSQNETTSKKRGRGHLKVVK